MSGENDGIQQIGEVAGQIWRELAKVEKSSISKLVKSVDAPRDSVMQGIGWLARENKIEITGTTRGRSVSLTDAELHSEMTQSLQTDAA